MLFYVVVFVVCNVLLTFCVIARFPYLYSCSSRIDLMTTKLERGRLSWQQNYHMIRIIMWPITSSMSRYRLFVNGYTIVANTHKYVCHNCFKTRHYLWEGELHPPPHPYSDHGNLGFNMRQHNIVTVLEKGSTHTHTPHTHTNSRKT